MSESAARVYFPSCITPIARCADSTIGIADLIEGVAAIATSSRTIEASDYFAFNCLYSVDPNGQPDVECRGVLPFRIQIGKSQGLAWSQASVSDHRLFDCARAGTDALVIVISNANVALNAIIQLRGGLTLGDLDVLFADGPKNFEDCPSLNGLPLGPVNLYSSAPTFEADDCSNDQACVAQLE